MMQSVEALPEAAELKTSLGTVGNDVEEVPASFQHSSDNESFKSIYQVLLYRSLLHKIVLYQNHQMSFEKWARSGLTSYDVQVTAHVFDISRV